MRRARVIPCLWVLVAVLLASGSPMVRAEEQAPLVKIAELTARGGPEAATQLAEFLAEEVAVEVRSAALEGLAQLGLRSPAVTRAVRRAAEAPAPASRAAALRTLGRVGDGQDVPRLLKEIRSTEGKIRSAALSALGELCGRRLPASPTRCEQWWQSNEPRSRKALEGALYALPEVLRDPAHTASHRATIARDGWVDPASVARVVCDWLTDADHRLRAEACHAIGVLRLATLADAVRDAHRFANETDEEQAAFAMRALGLAGKEPSMPGADS